jgi:integrase
MGAVSKFSAWVAGSHPELNHQSLNFRTLRFKVEKRADEQRDAFTVEEVQCVLAHADMPKFKAHEPHKFWLIWIAAHSGMRLEEIAQLDPQKDIYQDEAGVWVFDINYRDGKQLKNKVSKRVIPVHPALQAQGLLDYAAALRDQRATRLFPRTAEAEGRVGKNAGKTVNRFIQLTVGIPKSLHSFRHTVATLLQRARVDEPVAAAMLGHRHGGITYSRYGKGYLTEVLLAEAIPHIDYSRAL